MGQDHSSPDDFCGVKMKTIGFRHFICELGLAFATSFCERGVLLVCQRSLASLFREHITHVLSRRVRDMRSGSREHTLTCPCGNMIASNDQSNLKNECDDLQYWMVIFGSFKLP
jgi:hypothetical protein